MIIETKLPEEFNSDGFDMKLVERDGDLAIYTQSKRGHVIAWEAIRIRHRGERIMPNGDTVGRREVYPAPSEFGTVAWSCASLERARERLAALRKPRAL